jgi:uncharacterized protein
MKLLIDIGHPAHVHLFKHLASEMIKKGHEVLFTCREKEFETVLLRKYGFRYRSFGKKYITSLGKMWGLVEFGTKEYLAGVDFKPDILLSHGSPYAAHASFLLRKPHISFEDTFNPEQIRLYLPFTKVVFTSEYEHPLKSKKIIRYAGYNELAYLHPKRFTPDTSILDELGIAQGGKYVILRFISWNATHDRGKSGITFENKLKTVEKFSKFASVFISSESELPAELQSYQIGIEPEKMHDAIACADLMFGESPTMAEEAAMLGTPAIYLSTLSTHYTAHLEKAYKLLYNFCETEFDQQRAIELGEDILQRASYREQLKSYRDIMLASKIDVTAMLVWFVENYPKSEEILRENPDFQYTFR